MVRWTPLSHVLNCQLPCHGQVGWWALSSVVTSDTAKVQNQGSSLGVQWLRLCALNAGGMGLIPDQGTKTPYAVHGLA